MKYRDNMTTLEKEMLLRELLKLDACLKQMDGLDSMRKALTDLEAEIDAEKEPRKAALNHRGQP